jgi:hypothetical protein
MRIKQKEKLSLTQSLKNVLIVLAYVYLIALLWIALFSPVWKETFIRETKSIGLLVTLVILSFTLAFLPLQLPEEHRKKIRVMYYCKRFIFAGLLLSLGFLYPSINAPLDIFTFLFPFITSIIGVTVGIAVFVITSGELLYDINELSKMEELEKKREVGLNNKSGKKKT